MPTSINCDPLNSPTGENSFAAASTSNRQFHRLDSLFLEFPQMHIGLLHPTVADDRAPSLIQLHHFGAVVVFKSIIQREPSPRDPLRIGLLVRIQAALAGRA